MQKVKSVSKHNTIYTSMGLTKNPDESNFCFSLIRFCRELNDFLTLAILEYPKFPLEIDPASLPVNTGFLSFLYATSGTKNHYYRILLNSDLILCGGTTTTLDSCFVGTNVELIASEVAKQPYDTLTLEFTQNNSSNYRTLNGSILSRSSCFFCKIRLLREVIGNLLLRTLPSTKGNLFPIFFINTVEKINQQGSFPFYVQALTKNIAHVLSLPEIQKISTSGYYAIPRILPVQTQHLT